MSRVGRKRKQCKREGGPAGRPQSERVSSPRDVARTMPHRRIVGDDAVHDPRCETPIGCLAVIGAIPGREWGAAVELAGVVRRYRAVVRGPSTAPSIAGVNCKSDPHPNDELDEREPDDRTEAEIFEACRTAYVDAKEEVKDAMRCHAWPLVVAMAVDGQSCPPNGFRTLMLTLRVLAGHFERQSESRSHSENRSVAY